jgi:ankyrin repeat protein
MILAVNSGFAEGVSILITYRANVNLANSAGETPLIRAVQLRDMETVRILLDAKADPDQTDIIAGLSARDYASQDPRMPTAIAKALAAAPRSETKAVAGPKL